MEKRNLKQKLVLVFYTFFWLLFASIIFLHFWIGDVVVDRRIIAEQHYLLLRENKDFWQQVHVIEFWLSYITQNLQLLFCTALAFVLLIKWLRNNKQNEEKAL